MHILYRNTLINCWQARPDVKEALKAWYYDVSQAKWQRPSDVRIDHPTVMVINNNGLIFKLQGGRYRLSTTVYYEVGMVLVRFIGTSFSDEGVARDKLIED
ncbi:MAG: type II toxin-antitoxin system HigB family toxin [Leptolyngbyaceae bacterium]|nr:type II toxin-antitoxin system HigB family toxin [Leptolyngbyaceae bacterium]